MAELILPASRLHAAWLEAQREWGPGLHEDGFGLTASDDVDSPSGFATWVARLGSDSASAAPVAGCTYRWIVDGYTVLGGIALRYGDTEFIRWAGHVGYGIRPSARGCGLATWALGQMLTEAPAFGLARVLIVCAADNQASAITIERNGGVLEGVEPTKFGPVRRYWIPVA